MRTHRVTALRAFALLMLFAAVPVSLRSQGTPAAVTPRPKVLLVATVGTIAGVQNAPGTLGGYRAGALTAEQVIASVPELARFAEVETEQFSNVASTAITPAQWVGLSKRINKVLAERSDLAGVVVTHGTDRLEETAFFLYLTIKSDKPVVVVGAQRPATGISPDGPINLLAAVRTVISPQAAGKGVMVVMDDRILSAREVRKLYQRTGGCDTGEMGMLGVVSGGGAEFFFSPTRRHGSATEFDVTTIDSLPTVELTFSYPGGKGQQFNPKPAGVVVATTGFTRDESVTYRTLRSSGVVLVTAFPSGDNVNTAGGGGPPPAPAAANANPPAPTRPDSARPMTAADSAAQAERNAPPAVVAQHLTPQKARILLMLALTKTRDPREIQRYFVAY